MCIMAEETHLGLLRLDYIYRMWKSCRVGPISRPASLPYWEWERFRTAPLERRLASAPQIDVPVSNLVQADEAFHHSGASELVRDLSGKGKLLTVHQLATISHCIRLIRIYVALEISRKNRMYAASI